MQERQTDPVTENTPASSNPPVSSNKSATPILPASQETSAIFGSGGRDQPEQDLEAAIWLALISQSVGLNLKKQRQLIHTFQGLCGLFTASPKAVAEVLAGPPDKVAGLLRYLSQPSMRQKAATSARQAWALGIRTLDVSQPLFPGRLLATDTCPAVLYYRGRQLAAPLSRSLWVTVIGTRNPTHYGRAVTRRITEELVAHGVVIVSGMARGIDTVAHQTALQARGLTVAVVGCGLDIAYPPENQNLMKAIAEHGLLLSEHPPGTPPRRQNFPARNRILSGLADVVAVMEASRKSGTLITAGFAADQGRDVYAVPGSIMDDACAGCHQLIRDGASLLVSAQDILWREPAQYLQMLVYPNPSPATARKPQTPVIHTAKSQYRKCQATGHHDSGSLAPGHQAPARQQPDNQVQLELPSVLAQIERPAGLLDGSWSPDNLLPHLRGQRLTLDQLLVSTGRSLAEVTTALSFFELRGDIVCERGRYTLTEQGYLSI